MRNRHHLAASLLAALLVAAAAAPADAARIKDVASIRGVRSNQLVGYGIVVGLDGTGDDQQVYFTLRSVQLMLQRLGVPAAQKSVFDLRNLRLRNTAAVMVTANLPPFARAGSRIDVTVSALGNAKSLQGGTLLMTPLRGVDLKVYALAQGQLTTGGFGASGRTGSRVQKGHRNVARVPRGAIVEREVPSQFVHNKKIVIALRRPDFTTASRVVQVVNRAIGNGAARSSDPATVVVTVPDKDAADTVTLISKVETLVVTPDARDLQSVRAAWDAFGEQADGAATCAAARSATSSGADEAGC